MKNILIVSDPEDLHAIAVSLALQAKGHNVTLWSTSNYPKTQDMTLVISSGSSQYQGNRHSQEA